MAVPSNDGTWQFHHIGQANTSIPGVVYPNIVNTQPSFQNFGYGTTTNTSAPVATDLSWGDRIGNWFGNLFSGSSSATPSFQDWFAQSHPGITLEKLPFAQQLQAQQIYSDQMKWNMMDKYAGLGPNLATAKLGFDILGGIGSWVQGNKNLQFARDQLNWQKNAWQQQFDIAKEDRDRAIADRNRVREQFTTNA